MQYLSGLIARSRLRQVGLFQIKYGSGVRIPNHSLELYTDYAQHNLRDSMSRLTQLGFSEVRCLKLVLPVICLLPYVCAKGSVDSIWKGRTEEYYSFGKCLIKQGRVCGDQLRKM